MRCFANLIALLTFAPMATERQEARDGGLIGRARMRLAVTAFFFAQGICFSTWASRIPNIKTALELSEGQLGTILLALPLGQMLTMPFSGRLVTRFGSRRILRVMGLTYAVALTNIGLATNFWQLMLCLFAFGICGNMSNIAVNTQGVLAEQQYDRPVMTSFHGAWSAAGVAGAILGLLMSALHVPTYTHFWVGAGLAILINQGFHQRLVPGNGARREAGARSMMKPDRILIQLGVIGFCSMAAEGAMFDWSGVYFKDILQTRKELVPLGYASFMLMMAGGRFVGDRLIRTYGRQQVMQVCGALISGGLLISVIWPKIYTCIPGFMMVGMGVSVMVPSVVSLAGRFSKLPAGRALAFTSGISYFGFLLGPPLIGYIAELSSLRYSYAVIAVFGLIISVLVARIQAIRDERPQTPAAGPES